MIRFASSPTASLLSRAVASGKLSTATSTNTNVIARRGLQTVSLQLDYYMSAQFAGIASALTNNMYEKAGIDLQFLPICPVGLEMERVRQASADEKVTIGSVEQNIFIPTLYNDPSLKLKAVAAMFRRTPLCLASLGDGAGAGAGPEEIVVGAHEDTVSLIQRILSSGNGGADPNRTYSVIASPRATKNTDLMSGKLGAIQAYLTTEVPALEQRLRHGSATPPSTSIVAPPLEGMNGARLGYSQLMFTPEEDLLSDNKREVVQTFLDVTFRGWDMAIRDNEAAADAVEEAKSILALDDESNDHWDGSSSYAVQNVGMCCAFVKETFQGDRYGVLNAERFNEATEWLLGDKAPPTDNFGLDATAWQPSPKLLAGGELGRKTLEEARKSAELFASVHGRKPSLAVITVGELSRYCHGDRRLDIYSNGLLSWFSKGSAGTANNFDVKEITLPKTTTTDELLSQIYSLKQYDGIQLMWPLPSQVDASKCYNAIEVNRDVDGAHYLGQMELDPKNATPMPPVTPAAAIALIEEYGVSLNNKFVLVVGRSRIVGAPLAYMVNKSGGIVTVAHSEVSTDNLKALVGNADVIFACAGSPGLLKTSWVKPGAEIISIGTTFDEQKDLLVSDFDNGDLDDIANRYSPVPGGVGPLSNGFLFKNVAAAAWKRAQTTGNVDDTWNRTSGTIERTFHFRNYDSALSFSNDVNSMSRELDHHANMTFRHECVDGVDVTLEFFTYEANEVTDKDYTAAKMVNEIARKNTK